MRPRWANTVDAALEPPEHRHVAAFDGTHQYLVVDERNGPHAQTHARTKRKWCDPFCVHDRAVTVL